MNLVEAVALQALDESQGKSHILCHVSKQYIIRTIIEFEGVSSEERMDLDSTKLKFKYFHQCLGSEVRTSCDNAKDGKPEKVMAGSPQLWHLLQTISSLPILPLRKITWRTSRKLTP
jgi:hypothetical protein